MFKFLLFFLGVVISSHSLALTIDLEKMPRPTPKKKDLKSEVILDARPAFQFAIGHLLKALPIRWEDYSQNDEPHKGSLDPDSGLLARKLSVLGIYPAREVMVLGLGAQGHGEEGRIAWMLAYLGVKNIRVLPEHSQSGRRLVADRMDVDAAPLWIPKVNEKLRATRRDIEKVVREKPSDVVLIDVRSQDEFSGKKPSSEGVRAGHIPGAIHLDWKKFVNKDGVIVSADNIERVLREAGIDSKKELIFYDWNGVGSGYAAFATLQAGLHSRNYDGSFAQWVSEDSSPVSKSL